MAAYHSRLNLQPNPDAVSAAVLILLFPDHQARTATLFIRRISHAKDQHSGQLAFPGGRLEPDDDSIIACALREANEEINLAIDQVEVLGKLSPLYIPVSNYLVTPVVGLLRKTQAFKPQVTEVEAIIKKELWHFQVPSTRKKTDIQIQPGFKLKNVPYFDLDGQVLWGATAMMLNELLTLMAERLPKRGSHS